MLDTTGIAVRIGPDVGMGDHHTHGLTAQGKTVPNRHLPNGVPRLWTVPDNTSTRVGPIPLVVDHVTHCRDRGNAGGRLVSLDAESCEKRNTVGRCVNNITAWQSPGQRYDKTPDSHLAGLQPPGALIWLRGPRPIG